MGSTAGVRAVRTGNYEKGGCGANEMKRILLPTTVSIVDERSCDQGDFPGAALRASPPRPAAPGIPVCVAFFPPLPRSGGEGRRKQITATRYYLTAMMSLTGVPSLGSTLRLVSSFSPSSSLSVRSDWRTV